MQGAGEDLVWADESEDDDLAPVAVHAVALKYYRQWREGRLDPNEPIRTELLLAAEHLLNDMQSQAAAMLMPQATVKLSLPGMPAQPACETTNAVGSGTAAGNADEPELL